MAREYAQVKLSIWADDDFRGLSEPAQRLYFLLLTSPSLSYCGVADWRPVRLAALSASSTRQSIEQAAEELVDLHYLVIDEDTEEVLVRSFIRNDEILKQPKMALAMLTAWAGTASGTLRAAIVREIQRLHAESPTLPAFTSTSTASGERLRDLLGRPDPNPSGNPTGNPSGNPTGNPSASGNAKGSVNPTGSPNPYPSPEPSTQNLSGDHAADAATTQKAEEATTGQAHRSKRSPELPLSDNWAPRDRHRAKAADLGLDVDHQTIRFRTHAKANDRRQRNWDASFDLWLLKAVDLGGNGNGRSAVAVREDGSIDADAVLGKDTWQPETPPPEIKPGTSGYATWARLAWEERQAERQTQARETLARRGKIA